MKAHRATDQTPAPPTPAEILDDVLTDISTHLRAILRWLPLLRDMPDTHRDGIGFIPPATRQLIGRQFQREQRELREAQSAGFPVGRGNTRAPGNMTAWSLEAEIEMTLRHLLRFAVRRQPHLTAPPVPRHETTEETISRFRAVAMAVTDLSVATAIATDLAQAVESCRRTLFGEDRTELAGSCPHCGRRTLVVYLQTGVIRCERPRDTTGHHQPCNCHHPLCPCHVDPRFEHHWLRDRADSHIHSWNALAGALKQLKPDKDTP